MGLVPFLKDGFFNYQDFKNYFVEAGEGDPLIFLHPLGGSVELWMKNIPAFVQSHRVLALDFLGCGKSDKPDIPYSLANFSERLIAFLDDRKIERATLVGNSLGGHVALMAASHYPTRVSRIILANPSGVKSLTGSIVTGGLLLSARVGRHLHFNPADWSMRTVLHIIHGSSKEISRELTEYYSREMGGKDETRWKRAFVRTLEAIVKTHLDEEVTEMDQPTLIIWGKKDHLLGSKGGETLMKMIRNAKLEQFKNVGHFPQIERPIRFNECVKAFLSTTA